MPGAAPAGEIRGMQEPVTIAPEDPGSPDALALIAALEAELAPFYPPEDQFGYSPEKLRAEGVHFLVARRGGAALGCGGMQGYGSYGELKRFYAAPEARGTGVAEALLAALESEARARGLGLMRLETGIFQHAALRFYARHGYAPCPRFGAYPENATSVFLEKPLGV